MKGEDLNDVTKWIDEYQTGTCTLDDMFAKEKRLGGESSTVSDHQKKQKFLHGLAHIDHLCPTI